MLNASRLISHNEISNNNLEMYVAAALSLLNPRY